MDVYPVTVRGPLTTTRQGLVTFARVFTHEGKFYIAQSRDKGRTVTEVSVYEAPKGEPVRRGNKNATWGPWSWSGCGCLSAWRTQSIETLVAMVPVPEAEPVADGAS